VHPYIIRTSVIKNNLSGFKGLSSALMSQSENFVSNCLKIVLLPKCTKKITYCVFVTTSTQSSTGSIVFSFLHEIRTFDKKKIFFIVYFADCTDNSTLDYTLWTSDRSYFKDVNAIIELQVKSVTYCRP
jgi:hypothetical protein